MAKTILIIVLGVLTAALIVGIVFQATDLAQLSDTVKELDLEEVNITQPNWEEWLSPALLPMLQTFIGRAVFVEEIGLSTTTVSAEEIGLTFEEMGLTLPSEWHPVEKEGEEGKYEIYKSKDGEKIAIPVEDEDGNLAIVSRSVMDSEKDATEFLDDVIKDYSDDIDKAGFDVDTHTEGDLTIVEVQNEDLNLAIQVHSWVSKEAEEIYVTNIIALTSQLDDLDTSQNIFESLS